MKTAAIIAEFNPFHNGHAEIIRQARDAAGCDRVVILMSGNYVQRGVPAMIDRQARCRAALDGGADLVISMPTRYCTSSAENYAYQSVRLLNALGCIDSLIFGSECGDIHALSACASFLSDEDSEFRDSLQRYLKEGCSFPRARALAAPQYDQILSHPNNTLAVEYLKALIRTCSSIRPYTIKRLGADYHDDASIDTFASASAIRRVIEEILSDSAYGQADHDGSEPGASSDLYFSRCMDRLSESVPEDALRTQIQAACRDGILTGEDFSLILAEKVWSANSYAHFLKYEDVSEDLAKSIFNFRDCCSSFGGFAEKLKNKSITRTRINRALLHIALGIQTGSSPLYAHILGCRASHADILGKISAASSVPVITRPARDLPSVTPEVRELFEEERRVTDLYYAVRAVKRKATVTPSLSQKFIKV